MKEYIRLGLQPLLLLMMLLVLMVLNTFATSLSLDLLFTMVGIAVLMTIFRYFGKSKGSGAIVQMIYMVFFVYLAFSFLIVGGMVTKGIFAFVLYIVLLVLDWIGLGYTAIRFKNLMKL
jgi:hypothetical protein